MGRNKLLKFRLFTLKAQYGDRTYRNERLSEPHGFIAWIRFATMRKLVSGLPAFDFGIVVGQRRQIEQPLHNKMDDVLLAECFH